MQNTLFYVLRSARPAPRDAHADCMQMYTYRVVRTYRFVCTDSYVQTRTYRLVRRSSYLQARTNGFVRTDAYCDIQARTYGFVRTDAYCDKAAALGSKQRVHTKVAFLAEIRFLLATAAKREYIPFGQGGHEHPGAPRAPRRASAPSGRNERAPRASAPRGLVASLCRADDMHYNVGST